jgi:hypothetical protein
MRQQEKYAAPEYRVEAGYEFPVETLLVTAEEQRKLHGFCSIPETRYGDWTDPSFLARRPILLNTASMTACHPSYAKVHTVHRIQQFFPVKLDEPVTMTGRFVEVSEATRGWLVRSRWRFFRSDGELALLVEPDVMMIDPDRAGAVRSGRPDSPAAKRPEEEGFLLLNRKQCTPETTLGYCEGTQNLIHIDPEYARGFGFRAPIIAGNQTVNFLLEGLAMDGPPHSFDIVVRLLRPVFWDDAVRVLGRRGGEEGRLTEIRAVSGDGKLVADCQVRAVRYGAGEHVSGQT